jgi:Transmembrane secretion effector
LLPFLIKEEMGGTANDLGTVYAMGGLGAISAAMVMAHWGTPRRNMSFMYISWSIGTLCIAGYGLAQFPWEVMLACFAFNALETAGLVVWITTRQALVPARLQGRVSSLQWLIATGLMPLSYVFAGPAASLWGTRPTLFAAGVLGAVFTFAFLFLPGMRSAERRNAVKDASSAVI